MIWGKHLTINGKSEKKRIWIATPNSAWTLPDFQGVPNAAKAQSLCSRGPETSVLNLMGGCKTRRTVEQQNVHFVHPQPAVKSSGNYRVRDSLTPDRKYVFGTFSLFSLPSSLLLNSDSELFGDHFWDMYIKNFHESICLSYSVCFRPSFLCTLPIYAIRNRWKIGLLIIKEKKNNKVEWKQTW